ncbi:MAG: DUF5799 family protein [Salinirussus sp.]
MPDWTEKLAGARMQVDKRFEDRVRSSRFSNQEWGMIMTAVEWQVRHPDEPARAELVAVTEHFPEIIPELDRINSQLQGPATGARGSSGGGIGARIGDFLGSLTGNGGSSENEEKRRDAERLVQAYADELQEFLEERGRWADICEAAAAER